MPALLTFREETIDGQKKAFVTAPWPQHALIDADLIQNTPDYMVVDGSTLTVRVENGFAIYRNLQKAGGRFVCRCSESEFLG